MQNNFTPLPDTVAHGKGAVKINMVLIIIALIITMLLGGLMWFLVVQKQQEESKANIPSATTPQRTIEQVEVSAQPAATTSATPTTTQAPVNPVASPSSALSP